MRSLRLAAVLAYGIHREDVAECKSDCGSLRAIKTWIHCSVLLLGQCVGGCFYLVARRARGWADDRRGQRARAVG